MYLGYGFLLGFMSMILSAGENQWCRIKFIQTLYLKVALMNISKVHNVSSKLDCDGLNPGQFSSRSLHDVLPMFMLVSSGCSDWLPNPEKHI